MTTITSGHESVINPPKRGRRSPEAKPHIGSGVVVTQRKVENLTEVSNGGEPSISSGQPYRVEFTLEGSTDMLFHRWNCEAVEEKAKAAKNSKAKKSDDIESYVYRDPDGGICIPGEYVRQSILHAAKFKQDPRSPRKSAMDLYKACVVSMTPLAPLGVKTWDYLDKRRAVVQRNAINRVRPAMLKGWKATFVFMVTLPDYINQNDLHDTLGMAGRLIGLGDFRPTYGRFIVTAWEVLTG